MPVPRHAKPGKPDAITEESSADQTTIELSEEPRRQRRLASLRRVAGIWANRTDIPADGLQYERELRNEWQ